jgi:hypothetical protein
MPRVALARAAYRSLNPTETFIAIGTSHNIVRPLAGATNRLRARELRVTRRLSS